MTAMVECLFDANKTEMLTATGQTGVKVLTSVSRINISFGQTTTVAQPELEPDQRKLSKPNKSRVLSKSFKNITMNNTIGVGGKSNIFKNLEVISFHDGLLQSKTLEKSVPFVSRKMACHGDAIEELNQDSIVAENNKDIFRKVKLHSDSEGFRSPLKQINNQLVSISKQ